MNTIILSAILGLFCLTLVVVILIVALFVYVYVKLSSTKNFISDVNSSMLGMVEGITNTQSQVTDFGKALLEFTKYYRNSVNRYRHSNGMYAWYVSLATTSISNENKLMFVETIFINDNSMFIPSIVGGVLRRKLECESITLLSWHSLTEEEFKQDANSRTQLTSSDFN